MAYYAMEDYDPARSHLERSLELVCREHERRLTGGACGFGSLLAAWSAADALSSEMRSGTILAVMARPVRRWEFLLGKYLGVQLLMLVFVVLMLGLNYLLAWIGGATIQTITSFTRPINYLGLPALVVPAGRTPQGLPIGLQLIGRPFGDEVLIALGRAFQVATDYHQGVPPAP